MHGLKLRKLLMVLAALGINMGFNLGFIGVSLDTAWAKEGKGREKFITREGKSSAGGKGSKGDSTKVNFDEVDIGGQRKTPLGTLVTNNKNSRDYDFIKLRQRWHPEMIESASSLESGGR